MSTASDELSNEAVRILADKGDPTEALRLAQRACVSDPGNFHAWYARGLASRAMGDFGSAESSLIEADARRPDQGTVLLALAIAQQLQGKYPQSIETLRRLLTAHPACVLGYNTLGMTQKLMGEPAKAAQNYAEGILILVREWVKTIENSATAERHDHFFTRHHLYVGYVTDGLLFKTALAGSAARAFVSGEAAEADADTRCFAGWYWRDQVDGTGNATRLWYPNAFNACAAYLKSDGRYASLTGNRATVLRMLGNAAEAQKHVEEFEDFQG